MLTVQPCASTHACARTHTHSTILIFWQWCHADRYTVTDVLEELGTSSFSLVQNWTSLQYQLWRRQVPPECRYEPVTQYNVKTNKTIIWTLPSPLLNYRRIINILLFTTVQSFLCHTANTYSSPEPISISQVMADIFCKMLHVLALILLNCTFYTDSNKLSYTSVISRTAIILMKMLYG
jgi:hypothetical protein